LRNLTFRPYQDLTEESPGQQGITYHTGHNGTIYTNLGLDALADGLGLELEAGVEGFSLSPYKTSDASHETLLRRFMADLKIDKAEAEKNIPWYASTFGVKSFTESDREGLGIDMLVSMKKTVLRFPSDSYFDYRNSLTNLMAYAITGENPEEIATLTSISSPGRPIDIPSTFMNRVAGVIEEAGGYFFCVVEDVNPEVGAKMGKTVVVGAEKYIGNRLGNPVPTATQLEFAFE
jgi:hypothetical protein